MDDLAQILDSLDEDELSYVFARSKTNKDKPAYEAANIPRSTFYAWDESKRDRLNGYALQIKRNRLFMADRVLLDATEQAARCLVALLDATDERVRLGASKEVLDRTTGKPVQRQEITGANGNAIEQRMKSTIDLSGMSIEQLRALAQSLKR